MAGLAQPKPLYIIRVVRYLYSLEEQDTICFFSLLKNKIYVLILKLGFIILFFFIQCNFLVVLTTINIKKYPQK